MKKKILFLIPTLGSGGAEKVLVTLVNNMDSDKFDITLFSIFDVGENKKNLSEEITYNFFFKKIFRGNKFLFKLLSPEKLYALMIKEKYDVIVSYLEGPATRIVSGCKDENVSLLNWVHTEVSDLKEFSSSFRSTKEMIGVYNKYDITIFVSESAKKSFYLKNPQVTCEGMVKYNVVDSELVLSRANETIDDVQFDKNKINLVSVGRFIEEKGYVRLLKVIKHLSKRHQNIHLYLIGKGELQSKYEKYIYKENLENYVTIIGFRDNPYKYVKFSDLFVCSSFREGYSTAVTEALILGTPVITTLCSGMKELLGGNNEFGLITNNDEESLYEGLETLLSNPRLLSHYKERAVERGQKFKKDRTIVEIETIFENV